jgi:hypothetical protein
MWKILGARGRALLCAPALICLGSCDTTQPDVGTVAGSVTVEGSPLVGTELRLLGDTVVSRTTDHTGGYRFEAAGGTYLVEMTSHPADAAFTETSRAVTVGRGQVETVAFAGSWIRTSAIGGYVSTEWGPLEGLRVSASGPSAAEAVTDADGYFSLTGLRAGPYDVTLSGYDPERYAFAAVAAHVSPGVDERVSVDFSGVLQPPLAPVGVTAANDGAYRVVVGWQDLSSYETEYRVERRQGEAAWEVHRVMGADTDGMSDDDLVPGTSYAYRVQACNEVGCSEPTEEVQARTDQIPPAPPGPLEASSLDANTVLLAWEDRSFNEEGFHVSRSGPGQTTWVEVAVTVPGATAYTDAGLAPDSEYGYRVRSCNEAGCSTFTADAVAATPPLPPAPPDGLTAVAVGATRIDLAWHDGSENEDGFRLERRQGEQSTWAEVGQVGTDVTSYVDHDLVPGTPYSYRLRACNAGGCSAYTDEAGAETDQVPPPAPAALDATATGQDRIALTWIFDGLNANDIRVERRVEAAPDWIEVATKAPTAVSHVDQGLQVGTTYGYRLRACNEVGCSAYSPTASATTLAPPGDNLVIAAVHLTQAVQTLDGSVPLIADRDGLLRVFVTASAANTHQPDVRVRVYQGASLVETHTLPAPSTSVPTSADAGSLDASWNLIVPGHLVAPGLGVRVDVDPDDRVPETNETDNAHPSTGTFSFDVRAPSPFDIVFVPVRQSVNGLQGDPGDGSAFLTLASKLFPVSGFDVQLRAPYVTDAAELQSNDGNDAWAAVLSEMLALRAADGSSAHYYGVVKVGYSGGVAGMGYVGAPAAVGWDKQGGSGIAAHELGHNLGRRHAPCGGAGNPDPYYPYAGGSIGAVGYDPGSGVLRSPSTYKDFMGYCNPDWISDYTYEGILGFIESSSAPPASPLRAGEAGGLLIWGRIGASGAVLEPAFEVQAPPLLPERSGPYQVRGFDEQGRELFSVAFGGAELPPEAGGGRHFAMVLPLEEFDREALHSLRLDGPSVQVARVAPAAVGPGPTAVQLSAGATPDGTTTLSWDAERFPMALVRDATTGQIVSFARGGEVGLPSVGGELDVSLSDGVRSHARRLRIR